MVFSQQSTLLTSSVAALIISESRAFYPGSVGFKLLASSAFVWQAASACNSYDKESYDTMILLSLGCGLIGDFCLVPSRKRYEGTTVGGDKQPADEGKEGDTLWFKAGMGAFALNHFGYMMAFSRRGDIHWTSAIITFGLCVFLTMKLGLPFPNFISSSASTPTATKTDAVVRPQAQRRDSGVADLPESPSLAATPNNTLPPVPPVSKSVLPEMYFPADMKLLVFVYQQIISCMAAFSVATWKSGDGISNRIVLGAFLFMVSDLFVAWDVFGKPDTGNKPIKKETKERRGWKSRGVGWVLYFAAQMVIAGTACNV